MYIRSCCGWHHLGGADVVVAEHFVGPHRNDTLFLHVVCHFTRQSYRWQQSARFGGPLIVGVCCVPCPILLSITPAQSGSTDVRVP